MAKFIFNISAHVSSNNGNENIMDVFVMETNVNNTLLINDDKPVLQMAKAVMPLTDWDIDDGDDNNGTTYCQYVAYTDGSSYMLASWNEIDERTGCIKL